MKTAVATPLACIALLIAFGLMWYTLTMKPRIAPPPVKVAPQTLAEVEPAPPIAP
jgi:hypothetical protein